MSGQHLRDAERLLEENLLGVEDVLEAYGPEIVREGQLPELVELIEATSPSGTSGRWAVARWVEKGNLTSGGAPPSSGSADARSDVVQGVDLLDDPQLLEPPTNVVPRFAHQERVTMLYGPDKVGKSTQQAGAASALSAGHAFLGESLEPADVLWVNLEQHPGDLLRPFVEFGWEPERVWFLNFPHEPLDALRHWTGKLGPALVVVDTFHRLVEHLELEMGEMNDWSPVLADLREIALQSGTAVNLIHHSRRSDDEFLGSRAIGAGVDMRIGMTEGREAGVRDFERRGRWAVDEFSTVLTSRGGRQQIELCTGDLSLETRVQKWIRLNPGCGTSNVRDRVSGRAKDISKALDTLEQNGLVEDRRDGRAHAWFPADGADRRKTPGGTGRNGSERGPER